jgi:hypothetical protein
LGLVTIGSLIIIVDQIKEIIMKKIIFWTALISVLGLLIGACAKRDDDTTATPFTVSCDDTTASGSITIGSDTVSGTYLVQTWEDSFLSRPATGCNATTEYWGAPTGTQSVLVKRIVTSSTSFADYEGFYSDTACTSRLGYVEKRYSNVSVGDQVSGLDNSSGRPTSGYKVTYNGECGKLMGDTDAATDKLNATYAYLLKFNLLTTGTEQVFGMGFSGQLGDTNYDIWGAGDNGTTFSFYSSRGNTESQPSDWDANSGGNTYQR